MLFTIMLPLTGAAGLGLEAARDHPLFMVAAGVAEVDIGAEKPGKLLLFGMVLDKLDH